MDIRKTIHRTITKQLGDFTIVSHNNNVWFVDKKGKNWFIQIKNGYVIWNHYKFSHIPELFSISVYKFEEILSGLVYDYVKFQIKKTLWSHDQQKEVLNEISFKKLGKSPIFI